MPPRRSSALPLVGARSPAACLVAASPSPVRAQLDPIDAAVPLDRLADLPGALVAFRVLSEAGGRAPFARTHRHPGELEE